MGGECSALADIEARIRDASLCARQIAVWQSISRRRLDALFVRDVGMTITKSIVHRRLDRARLDLRSPANAKQTITQIAFALGFKDAAHFSRAFKQKFAVTPTRWRQSGTGAEETSV
jgi:AraC-like DNA-binding protein